MTGLEIATLVFAIVEKVGAMALKLLTTGSGKTPEEVRQEIKDAIDGFDDNWLEDAVKNADDKFKKPGP